MERISFHDAPSDRNARGTPIRAQPEMGHRHRVAARRRPLESSECRGMPGRETPTGAWVGAPTRGSVGLEAPVPDQSRQRANPRYVALFGGCGKRLLFRLGLYGYGSFNVRRERVAIG
jgi:hypothetical protein